MKSFLAAALTLVAASGRSETNDYFTIAVVDEQTGRGVPLVELRTVNNVSWWTDSNGIIAFGTHTLMPLVSRYLRQNPGVEVELILSDRFVDLVEEGFEAVFRTGPLADSSLAARALRPFRLLVLATAAASLRGPPP